MIRALFSAAMIFAATQPLVAHEYDRGDLHIAHPWTHPTPGETKNGAAFLSIENRGKQDDKLLSATSQSVGTVEIHAIIQNADIMKMRKVDKGVKLPAESTVKFEPGGLHIMMIGMDRKLKEGDSVPLTLVFEKAGKVDVEVKVEKREELTKAKSEAHAHH